MSILTKLKTNVAKIAIVGMTAFAAMGTTATCFTSHVYAESASTTTAYSDTDTILESKLQDLIDNAERSGSLISRSGNSFVMNRDGSTIKCTYEDAGTVHLDINLSEAYGVSNSFDKKEEAMNFVNKMHMINAKLVRKRLATCYKWFAVGDLPLVKLTYEAVVEE